MSWRAGSAFAPLGAANTPIVVTTTTTIASGERAILFVGNPTVSTLGGNAFSTIDILERFISVYYGGLSCHSFIAPAPITSGATITVTPGHANQKVAAMLLVQGDPHPTQAPYSTIVNNSDVISIGSNQWPLVDAKGLTWDKRLLIAVGASQNGASASPWSTVVAGSSAPLNGFTEVLDATQFSYLFEIYVREQDSNDAEIPSFLAGSATANQFGASGASAQQQGIINFIRAGAVQASVGPDALEYNDFPARSQPGSGSRPSVGQLWPR
jgi:hypothetical protein